jgi:hypothetical protein
MPLLQFRPQFQLQAVAVRRQGVSGVLAVARKLPHDRRKARVSGATANQGGRLLLQVGTDFFTLKGSTNQSFFLGETQQCCWRS